MEGGSNQPLHTLVKNNPLICSEHARTMDNQPDDLQENHPRATTHVAAGIVAKSSVWSCSKPRAQGIFESPTPVSTSRALGFAFELSTLVLTSGLLAFVWAHVPGASPWMGEIVVSLAIALKGEVFFFFSFFIWGINVAGGVMFQLAFFCYFPRGGDMRRVWDMANSVGGYCILNNKIIVFVLSYYCL